MRVVWMDGWMLFVVATLTYDGDVSYSSRTVVKGHTQQIRSRVAT